MTQEDNQLLLTDLCARLPYGVMIYYHYCNSHGDTINEELKELDCSDLESLQYMLEYAQYDKYDISWKPYLRPMSSMTEEEKEYYYTFIDEFSIDNRYPQFTAKYVNKKLVDEYIDWLNAHHFDYRGLIPKGLALEATEGMYNVEGKQ